MIYNANSNFEVAYNASEADYAALRTRMQRMTRGHSCFPEFNVGVYFDSRNAPYDQPSHAIWKNSKEWGLAAKCRLRYLGCDL